MVLLKASVDDGSVHLLQLFTALAHLKKGDDARA